VNLSVLKPEANDLVVFPNPTSDMLTLSSDGKLIRSAQVFDLSGRMLINLNQNSNISTVDVSSLSVGMYILQLNMEGVITSRKFVKK